MPTFRAARDPPVNLPNPSDAARTGDSRSAKPPPRKTPTKQGALMPTRDSAPVGSPCWTDLWTSDVEGSRRFYSELFGWEAEAPNPDFGGYFMFTRNGVPTAGAMGDMGDMAADNSWKIYLTSDDITKTVLMAEAEGAQV